jgi:2-succinyl-5-enolpyruvyl-6-hydroxy-3-cyclohexene-1-carboxylate synthase
LANLDRFIDSNLTDKPMIFEVFTNHEDESEALRLMSNIVVDPIDAKTLIKRELVGVVKKVVGESGVKVIKSVLKK